MVDHAKVGRRRITTSRLRGCEAKQAVSTYSGRFGCPASSVPQACGDIAATSAAYDFWNSPYFQPSDIRNAHIKSTIERTREHDVILAIQDTTNIDLTDHPAKPVNGSLYVPRLIKILSHQIIHHLYAKQYA